MSRPDFDGMRAARDGCPSDLELDRLDAGELAGESAAGLFAHIDECDECPARMALRASKFGIAPAVDARRIMAGVRRRLDDAPQPAGARARRWWSLWVAGLALAAAAGVAVMALRVDPEPDEGPGVRLKGDLALVVHRRVGSGSAPVAADAILAPGTALKFVVALPADGRVKIIGQEASGALYDAWPLDGQRTERSAGRQALPGAVELDHTPGRETFHLVLCPISIDPIVCTGPVLSCPSGCRTASASVVKGPR